MQKIFPVILFFTIIGSSGCLQLSPPEESAGSSSSNKTTSKKEPSPAESANKVDQYIEEWTESGVVDLRRKTQFNLNGDYSDDQIKRTTITIRGEDRVILRSTQAINFTFDSEVTLDSGDYAYLQVEEYNNGVSVFTNYDNDGSDINYELKID